MPVFALPDVAVLVLNVAFWVGSEMLAGYRAARLSLADLERDHRLLRLRAFEADGRWYERRLRIRSWKDRLPEAGTVFGGMTKRTLPGRTDADLSRFDLETRRAERAHWSSMLGLPLVVLWNPLAGVVLMVGFGLTFNLPFIVIQRYNRARIDRVLRRRQARRLQQSPTREPQRAPIATEQHDGARAGGRPQRR